MVRVKVKVNTTNKYRYFTLCVSSLLRGWTSATVEVGLLLASCLVGVVVVGGSTINYPQPVLLLNRNVAKRFHTSIHKERRYCAKYCT